VGSNSHDIVVEDGDIFNVAARLEALAKPGGICALALGGALSA
jgi:class 3 adenylate cyclase